MSTLAELEDDVRDFVGPGVYYRFFLPAGSTEWVDYAIKFACRQICCLMGLTRLDIMCTPSNNQIIIPGDSIKVVSCQSRWTNSGGAPVGKILLESTIQIEDQKNANWRSRTGYPTVWIQASGYAILLNGQPPSNSVLVGYIQDPTPMVNPTDTPDPRIPAYFHQYLKFAAAAWLLSQAGQTQDIKKASEHFAKFTNGIGVGAIPLANVDVRR
jgi:hypothetical protein